MEFSLSKAIVESEEDFEISQRENLIVLAASIVVGVIAFLLFYNGIMRYDSTLVWHGTHPNAHTLDITFSETSATGWVNAEIGIGLILFMVSTVTCVTQLVYIAKTAVKRAFKNRRPRASFDKF